MQIKIPHIKLVANFLLMRHGTQTRTEKIGGIQGSNRAYFIPMF